MELELIVGLLTGPAAGVGVSVYFLNRFMAFQKDVTDKIIEELRQDRQVHQEAISKMDLRLSHIETVIELFCKEKRNG